MKSSKVIYEDLSIIRGDEETVLAAVYGDDFSKRAGVWGSPLLTVTVRPQDIPRERIGSELTLAVQTSNKYPSAVPKLDFQNVRGLTPNETSSLMKILSEAAVSLSQTTSPMVCELVQIVEDFLWKHNRDPILAKRSEWEKMRDKENERNRQLKEEEDRIQSFMNEEISEPNRNSIRPVPLKDDSMSNPAHMEDNDHMERVRKELERQREALFDATDKLKNRVFLGFEMNDSDHDSEECTTSSEDPSTLNEDSDDDNIDLDVSNNHISSTSRYSSDFIELGVLGKGGGGEVLKVKNRLDRRIYAIKRIHLEPETGKFMKQNKLHNARLMREVKTISRMTHKNIVRYYQAWVEGSSSVDESNLSKLPLPNNEKSVAAVSDEPLDDSESSDGISKPGWWQKSPLISSKEVGNLALEDDAFVQLNDISVEDKEDSDTSSSWSRASSAHSQLSYGSVLYQLQNPLLTGFDFQQTYDNIFPKSVESIEQLSDTRETGSNKNIILYIQMEFCATTLRHLIDDGSITTKMGEKEIWRLLRQLTEALSYVHKLRVIHRDLKPSNIFLDSENNIRLGDFGLATKTSGKQHKQLQVDWDHTIRDNKIESTDDKSNSQVESPVNTHVHLSGLSSGLLTGGVGTAFYCAPEQEQPSRLKRRYKDYDVKADIFSLGIIIFELFHPPFSTLMERAENLLRLRTEHPNLKALSPDDFKNNDTWKSRRKLYFSDSFIKSSPDNVQKMILLCIQRNPEDRPTAEELLSSDWFPRAIEVDESYLQEALFTLAAPDSESRHRILDSLFETVVPHHVEVTFDTDIATKASITMSHKQRKRNDDDKDAKNASARESEHSFQHLNPTAAFSALTRAGDIGKVMRLGKEYESLRGVPQKVIISLANVAASSAAVTGSIDGVYGADPRVISNICTKLQSIFELHGAVHLRPPLLRPRSQAVKPISGSVELMNRRGVVLLLPEDLTVNFARSVGRGAGTVSHIKRYDIDKVYQKSISDNHPRESLEASFDIVFDDRTAPAEYFEAECIMVVCEVLRIIRSTIKRDAVTLSDHVHLASPLYCIKLNHTRLTELILDICNVPPKESIRRACVHILTLSACSPFMAMASIEGTKIRPDDKDSIKKDLDVQLANAMTRSGLPEESAKRLRIFLEDCLPLSAKFLEALSAIEGSIKRLHVNDLKQVKDPRRFKKYDEATKSLRSLRSLHSALESLKILPLIDTPNTMTGSDHIHLPIYISIDLGLRPRRKLHGPFVFQAVILPDNDQPNVDTTVVSSKGAIVADGGRYDDLVLRFSPPGNLISAPMCVGVRFSIGKLVECLYIERLRNALQFRVDNTTSTFRDRIESIRNTLGHPILKQHQIKCFIASANGLDNSFLSERAKVCAQLWMNDVPSDYVPHSGLIISFLQKSNMYLGKTGIDQICTLDQLCGICLVLNIPFVVIVQPHLLNDKGSIRLRSLMTTHMTQNYTDEIISVTSLATIIKERLHNILMPSEVDVEPKRRVALLPENSKELTRLNSSSIGTHSTDAHRIYIENDRYFVVYPEGKGDNIPKPMLKIMTTIMQKADSFLSKVLDTPKVKNGAHLVAVNVSFIVLRDFGTSAMAATSSQNSSIALITADTINKYPGHDKTLKTLGKALDYLLKQRREGVKHTDPMSSCHVLLYSIYDERFDLITLGEPLLSNRNVSPQVSKKEMHRSTKR